MKRTPLSRSGPPRRKTRMRRMSSWNRLYRTMAWSMIRQDALYEARGTCARCKKRRDRLHVHHKLPRSRGGEDHFENLAVLCFPCHRAIHDHTAKDWRDFIVSRKHG